MRSAIVIPSKNSSVIFLYSRHMGSVLQYEARGHGAAPQARHATGAMSPSVRRRISPTV